MGKPSKLSIEQRTEAVLSLLRREESAVKIARRYGISEQTLYRYRGQFLEGGKAGLASRAGKADLRTQTAFVRIGRWRRSRAATRRRPSRSTPARSGRSCRVGRAGRKPPARSWTN